MKIEELIKVLEIDCHLPDFNFENVEDSENLAYENKKMGDFFRVDRFINR